MEGFKNIVIEYFEKAWAKFVSAVKSAPAVYAYGVGTGVVIGWVFL